MQKQIRPASLLGIVALSVFLACHSAAPTTKKTSPGLQLLALCPSFAAPPDTVHFYLDALPPHAEKVSSVLLKACVGSATFDKLHFDTGLPEFWALGKYAWAPNTEACLLETTEFWFGKQTLLFIDTKSGRFLCAQEVAHFYGGDGGQTATESWWFRTARPTQLFVKNADHGFRQNEAAEPSEYLQESGTLLAYRPKGFRAIANQDSSVFIKNLRMHRTW